MNFVVESPEQAQAAVEFFNAFHDGFVRSFNLVSHDTFEDRHTHNTTGRLDLEIVFAHSNYGEGVPPFDQLIRARFFGVLDLRLAMTGLPTDWPITSLAIGTD